MTSLEEKVNEIIEGVSAEFNNMTYEERKRIKKYTSYMQILTIWQMLNKDDNLTTKRWRDSQTKWLKNCVESHLKEWWYE